ncbi:PREDICTED: beta carbonic anhydrase 5, chloroplastic isoform X1 [Prunus mume]|uniref:carbonic anhydrase n=1 Tax=Prunus mume TaxID=102107 RepID=A0ABM0N452_PRUMU|nr:PREDICTED: beta carbonic anhydrase 5, chloroplastic isoform X1 [Prunus mume]
MVFPIRSKARRILSTMAALRPSSTCSNYRRKSSASNLTNSAEVEQGTHVELLPSVKRHPVRRLEASNDSMELAHECSNCEGENVSKANNGPDLFGEMKERFLSFKKHKFLKESEHFQTLAQAQAPKFMVIACADSRVCPSNILGFQPGEAFMIRNVANLVPPFENGASETNAALEFAVNTLEVCHLTLESLSTCVFMYNLTAFCLKSESISKFGVLELATLKIDQNVHGRLQVKNILVIGHSSCAGIETLMRMQDDGDSSSLTHSWVINAKVAKLRTKAVAPHLSFDQQCRHCEKESINSSLLNLRTYPWIEDRAKKEMLSLHGGYYDFLRCTFEKWTLDMNGTRPVGGGRYLDKDRELWC